MKKAILGLMVAAACASAAASAPKFAEADQWRRDLRKAVDETTKMFMREDQRPAQGRRLAELVARAGKLFGRPLDQPFGSCVKAASLLQSAWQNQVSSIAQPQPVALSGQTTQAFEAGIEYWVCREAIDALDAPAKK